MLLWTPGCEITPHMYSLTRLNSVMLLDSTNLLACTCRLLVYIAHNWVLRLDTWSLDLFWKLKIILNEVDQVVTAFFGSFSMFRQISGNNTVNNTHYYKLLIYKMSFCSLSYQRTNYFNPTHNSSGERMLVNLFCWLKRNGCWSWVFEIVEVKYHKLSS